MRNVLIVIKHEIRSMTGRPVFWFMTFIFPLLITGFSLLPQIYARNTLQQAQLPEGQQGADVVAYVDQAGVLGALPPGVAPESVRAFPSAAAADAALAAGEVAQYYLIPADFRQTQNLLLVGSRPLLLASAGQENLFRLWLNYSATGDADLAFLLIDPTPMTDNVSLAPQSPGDANSLLGFVVPFAVMFILFFVITMSAGYMLQSVAKEKENRTAEVLLTSLRPRELMLGKVVGLGVVALFQMTIWLVGGQLLIKGGNPLLPSGGGYALPAGFLAWAVAYGLLGFALYASALAILGVLAPTMREGSQFTFVALLPLMLPLWFYSNFLQDPNGPVATFLSLFPLTAPTSMVTRLAAGGVPLWQLVVGLMGVAATAYLFVMVAARLFRADMLLSHASINSARIIGELRGALRRTGA